MTVLRRLKTLEKHEREVSGPIPNTIITVDEESVYRDAKRNILTKDERWIFRYQTGMALPVTGLLVIVRDGLNP